MHKDLNEKLYCRSSQGNIVFGVTVCYKVEIFWTLIKSTSRTYPIYFCKLVLLNLTLNGYGNNMKMNSP